jgi:hypothetical protein
MAKPRKPPIALGHWLRPSPSIPLGLQKDTDGYYFECLGYRLHDHTFLAVLDRGGFYWCREQALGVFKAIFVILKFRRDPLA